MDFLKKIAVICLIYLCSVSTGICYANVDLFSGAQGVPVTSDFSREVEKALPFLAVQSQLFDSPVVEEQQNNLAEKEIKIGFDRFLFWLREYFFVGKYSLYYERKNVSGPPVHELGRTKGQDEGTKKSEKKNKKGGKSSDKNTKRTPKRLQNGAKVVDSVLPSEPTTSEDKTESAVEALKKSCSSLRIRWADVIADKKPKSFCSDWLWDVAIRLNAAVQEAQKGQTLEEAINAYDPILNWTLYYSYKAVLDNPERVTVKRLMDAWFKYTFIEYNPAGNLYDFDVWYQSQHPVVNASATRTHLTFSGRIWELSATEDEFVQIMVSNAGVSRELILTEIRPDSFSSIALWQLLLHLPSELDFINRGVLEKDVYLNQSVRDILRAVFSGSIPLKPDERKLFEVWLDYIFFSQKIRFDWRRWLDVPIEEQERMDTEQ